MRNASKLARYKMMQTDRNGDYNSNTGYNRAHPDYSTDGNKPENRFRERQGKKYYGNEQYTPMRSYNVETPQAPMPYPTFNDNTKYYMEDHAEIDSGRRWEIIENRSEYNDDGMRRIRGFNGDGIHNHGMEHGAGKVIPLFNKNVAERWMDGLQNDDGTLGPHWSIEDVKSLMQHRGINEDPMRIWVAMNVEYSDSVTINRKYGVDRPEYYLDLACAKWLHDKDAVNDKLAAYYTYVVKH